MTDPIDEARAALERELYKYLPTDTCAQDRKDIRSAADRYALAVFDEGYAVHRLAVEGNWTDCNKRFDALRARLEARALLSPQAAEPRPRIVCLCGSTRFMDAFHEAGWRETLLGNIVLSVGVCKYAETPDGGHVAESLGPEVVKALDELHKRKIDLADEVLILNVGGYVGESTQSEIDYARAHGKPIRWLEDPQAAELPCPTIEQVEGAYGEALYEQERETR